MIMTPTTRRLDDLIEALIDYRGKTPAKTSSGVRLITAKVIKDGVINDSSFEYIGDEDYDAWMRRGLPCQGDILITTEAPLGEVARLRTTERIALAQRVILLRAKSSVIDPGFLFQALKSPPVKAELAKRATGTTVLGIKQSELREVRIPYVSVIVQCRIAAILSAYDDLIENNTKRIKILEEMARSLYREWFVEFRFPDHGRIELRRQAQAKVPVGWQASSLGHLVDEVRDAVDPRDVADDTPYFGLEHLPRRSTTLGTWGEAREVQSAKLRARRGEILFGKIRPYFHKVGVVPVDAICSSDAIVLRPRDALFFGLTLGCTSSDEFVAQATASSQGTKMPRANWEVLRKHPIPLPPNRILEQYNQLVVPMVDLASSLALKNRTLAMTRDMLLPRLISGEIQVGP